VNELIFMSDRRLNRDSIKGVNRNLVLNLVKSEGPISRRDISRRSGLSAATVTNLTAELIAEDLIHEMGPGVSLRGRPPVLLRLNNRAGFVVGVKVMDEALASVVTDLDAGVLAYRTVPLRASAGRGGSGASRTDPDRVLKEIAESVEAVIADAGVDRSSVLGVGLGLAGLVDGQAGVCRYSPVFSWRGVDLANPLRHLLGLEVILENDVNALTIAEQWFGHGHDRDHFCVVTVGRGVGVGVVVNGRFYRGMGGGAGELGHMTVQPDGLACDCGKWGCLEALASDGAVVKQALRLIEDGADTALRTRLPFSIDDVIEAAGQGDRLAQDVLAESGRWLGVGVANLVNLLDPGLVIIGGEGVAAGEWRFEAMRVAFRNHVFDGLADQTEFVIEPAGDDTWARGAACVVLGELFKSPLYREQRISLPASGVELASQDYP
jgi:N-acetylglucosamine repressor